LQQADNRQGEKYMSAINAVHISGNLTRDPELRYTAGGDAVCNITVAVNRKYKNGAGELKEEVCFVGATVFGKLAEICTSHLKKGSLVFVSGRLKQDTWEDPEGKKQTKTKVVVENIIFGKSIPQENEQEAVA
jgi:single-strand DNA-binding protein